MSESANDVLMIAGFDFILLGKPVLPSRRSQKVGQKMYRLSYRLGGRPAALVVKPNRSRAFVMAAGDIFCPVVWKNA